MLILGFLNSFIILYKAIGRRVTKIISWCNGGHVLLLISFINSGSDRKRDVEKVLLNLRSKGVEDVVVEANTLDGDDNDFDKAAAAKIHRYVLGGRTIPKNELVFRYGTSIENCPNSLN